MKYKIKLYLLFVCDTKLCSTSLVQLVLNFVNLMVIYASIYIFVKHKNLEMSDRSPRDKQDIYDHDRMHPIPH